MEDGKKRKTAGSIVFVGRTMHWSTYYTCARENSRNLITYSNNKRRWWWFRYCQTHISRNKFYCLRPFRAPFTRITIE